jgi:hypothetical protein
MGTRCPEPGHIRQVSVNFLVGSRCDLDDRRADSVTHRSVFSVALAYELYIPVSSRFCPQQWYPEPVPDGLVIFALHLAWAVLFGSSFFTLGLRP